MQGARILCAVGAACALVVPAAEAAAPAKPAKPTSRRPIVVSGEAIPLRALRHWQHIVAGTLGEPRGWRRPAWRIAATQLLIEHRWIEGEALRLGIVVTREETRDAYARQRRAGFPRTIDYRRYLRRTTMSHKDVMKGVRIDLLQRRIGERVTAGAADTGAAQQLLLTYRVDRQKGWLPQTTCYARWYVEGWCTKV
jgi:hypothetical protein